jgi:hypothetical protein
MNAIMDNIDRSYDVDGQPLASKQTWRNSRGFARTITECDESPKGFVSYVRAPPAEDNVLTTSLKQWRSWVFLTGARRIV